MKKRYWPALLFAGAMVSCAPFSRDLMRQVDSTLTLQEVQKDPQPYIGKTVLWGGVIVETTNTGHEAVVIIRKTDLDYEKRPTNVDRSTGRFLVRYAGFLDPEIYRAGREMTVLGEIVGKEIRPIGNLPYPYPIVLAKEIHLWERLPQYQPFYPPWYWEPYPYYWWPRYPYWW